MSLVADRALTAREFLDECIAFKRDHAPQGSFLRGLVLGKLSPDQLRRWAMDFYFYVEPAIPTIAAWLSRAPRALGFTRASESRRFQTRVALAAGTEIS